MTAKSPADSPPSPRGPGISLLALVAVAVAVAPHLDRLAGSGRLCLVQAVAGLPCPLCGGTRALAALGGGEFVAAFDWNPLAALAVILAIPLGAAMTLGWDLPAAWRRRLVLLVAAAAVMNWTYLLVVGR